MISSVQSLSHVWLSATPWTAAHQLPCPSSTSGACSDSCTLNRWCHSNHSVWMALVMPFIFCRPLLLPSIFPSIRVFSKESVLLIRWPKYWSFSFSISPSNDYSGMIYFRINWLDLLPVQGTLKSILQHHSSKASILQRSASFIGQLSHPYMTTGKNITLTKQALLAK